MPQLEEMDQHQDALLWPKTGDDAFGQATHDLSDGAAIPIKCRWVNKRRLSSDAQGNPITIDATVTTNRSIEVGSLMWLGRLVDLPGTSPVPESKTMIVVSHDDAFDLKGRFRRRDYMLQYYRATPTEAT